MIHNGYRDSIGAASMERDNRQEISRIRVIMVGRTDDVADMMHRHPSCAMVRALVSTDGLNHFRVINRAGYTMEQIALACDKGNLLRYGAFFGGDYINIRTR